MLTIFDALYIVITLAYIMHNVALVVDKLLYQMSLTLHN